MTSYSHWGIISPGKHEFVVPKTFIVSALAAEIKAKRDAYSEARYEHAFLLRCEGLTYREVGERLGVGSSMAQILVKKFGRRLGRAIRKARFS